MVGTELMGLEHSRVSLAVSKGEVRVAYLVSSHDESDFVCFFVLCAAVSVGASWTRVT